MPGRYQTTIKLLNVIQILGWIIAAISLFSGYQTYLSHGLLVSGLSIAPSLASGLLLMAAGQVGGVLIDIAENTAKD
ncbi:hypothetical protein VWX96_17310 [Phaeobacter sp. A90a-4f]